MRALPSQLARFRELAWRAGITPPSGLESWSEAQVRHGINLLLARQPRRPTGSV